MVGIEFLENSLFEPIELRMIRPSLFPVRYSEQKNSAEFFNLKSSIKDHGLLQPIVVRPIKHGFEIVAGHRRFCACKSLRWRFIPCKITEFSDKQAYEIQLTENLQRKSMDPIEEAEAYQKYVVDFGWGGVTDLGKKIGKSEEYVSHRMKLLKLPDDVKVKIATNNLSVSQASELVNLSPHINNEFIEDITNNKLTVRQIRTIKKLLKNESEEYGFQKEKKSKKIQIIKKTTLTLKITLSRIDDLIEDAHDVNKYERVEIIKFLMNHRQKIHSMIDDNLKYNKECLKH